MRQVLPFALVLGVAIAALGSARPAMTQAPDSPPPANAGGISEPGGGFMITPRRVVFEERTRSAAVSLINSGSDSASYRISLVRMRMSETGAFTLVDTAQTGEAFADTLVRFSPRQAELAPHETQVIRIQLRAPADLPAGEYRSHLLVQAIPRTRTNDADSTSTTRGVQVKIVPVYGTAIPVIVRHGVTSADVSVSDLAVRPGAAGEPPTAWFTLHRQGNRSVYGDLTLTYAPQGGIARVVGIAKGLSVYSPNPTRVVSIPLTGSPGGLTDKGRLMVSYTQPAPDGQVIAQSSFDIP